MSGPEPTIGVLGLYTSHDLAIEARKRFGTFYANPTMDIGPCPVGIDQFASVSGTMIREEDPPV